MVLSDLGTDIDSKLGQIFMKIIYDDCSRLP